MKNNDALKKHHFWILFGLVPLFVLIAVLMISSSVGGEITRLNGEIDAAKKDIGGKTSAKSKGDLAVMDKAILTVDGKKGGLWKDNWLKQKDLFTWPKSEAFSRFVVKEKVDGVDKEKPVRIEDLAFGQTIPETADEQFSEFKKEEFYLAEFSTVGLKNVEPGRKGMVDRIEPTQFSGGWRRHLRHVSDWGQKRLISDQIWLIMEDIWVQRSMLEAIKSVNDQMGRFERVKYTDASGNAIDDPESKTGPHDPLRRKFRSRIWEVSLEIARKGNRQYMKGTLENITERLQVLGIGKRMTLKVWLEANRDQDGNIKIAPDGQPDVEGIEPIEFEIGSEFLPGKGGKKTIKDEKGKEIEVQSNIVTMQPSEANEKDFDKYPNLIPAGKTVTEIVKVEQKFDTQTVPIRRIEAMQLGKMDSRYAALGYLKTPNKETFKALAAAGAGTTSGGNKSLTLGGNEGTGGGPGGRGFAGGDDRGGFAGGDGRSGGGPLTTVIDGNFARYVDVTEQVRRMPVGIVVIVDQSYIQDVLLAFANSPLRFQVTQVTWTRFRGNLDTGLPGGGSPDGPGYQPIQMPGQYGTGGFDRGADPDTYGYGRGTMQQLPGAPSAIGGGAARPSTPTFRPSIPGGSGGVRFPAAGGDEPTGYSPGEYGPFGGGGSMTTVSEAQLTSGLVELSIYGVVSLYEKYDPSKDPSAAKDGEAKSDEVKKDGEAKDSEAKKDTEGKNQDAPKDKDEPKDKKDAKTDASADPKKRVRRRPVKRAPTPSVQTC